MAAVTPTPAELDAKERTLRARESVEALLDLVISAARVGRDRPSDRTAVLTAVDILMERASQERDAHRDAVVAEYQRQAAQKGKPGHA